MSDLDDLHQRDVQAIKGEGIQMTSEIHKFQHGGMYEHGVPAPQSAVVIPERPASVRPEPKYKVGQIVCMNSVKKQLPFRILKMDWDGYGWCYAWNKSNYASESMLRSLTKEETGS